MSTTKKKEEVRISLSLAKKFAAKVKKQHTSKAQVLRSAIQAYVKG